MIETTDAGESKQVLLEDILESSPVIGASGDAAKPKETKPDAKPETAPVQAEEQSAESQVKEEKTEPELTEEQQIWKRDHEQKKKWEQAHTKRSQIISKFSDDEIIALNARMQLEEKVKDFKPEPLPEYIEVVDEFGDTVKIPSTAIEQMFNKQIEQAQAKWIKEFAPKVVEYDKLEQNYQEQLASASNQAAIVRLNEYYHDFPDMSIDFGEDNPTEKLNEIWESGDTHPDYQKLLDLKAVADRAATKKISMKDAHIELFGKRDQQKKADRVIQEERNGVQQERPGKSGKTPTKDEQFEEGLGIGVKRSSSVFD